MMAGLSATWFAVLGLIGTLIGGAGLGGMLKTWLDHVRGRRKDTDEVALTLVNQLQTRVTSLEDSSDRERKLCDAQLAVQRHRINNLSGNFDALLLLIEMAPDKASEMVAKIKERRSAQEQAEAVEKATLAAIGLHATRTEGGE
ncbi:hypothetical protein WG907_04290 [Sphingobium sp. AN558]|uniref:hypothetical protein n=1 Tax=Sphingobium sp. AN558 TaxID=3133442 RepID=UPI0030BE8553